MKTEKFLTDLDEIGKPSYEVSRLYFQEKGTSIFLKSKTWGLTSDHKVTVISTKPNLEFHPDSATEFIIYGFEDIYYKIKKDTLLVYNSCVPDKPKEFSSEITVRFIELEGSDQRRLEEEYKKGIKKIEY